MRQQHEARIGPWLVGLGAALWGTESGWRIPLNKLFDQPDVLVWWEHVLLVVMALPFVLPRLGELRRVRPQTLAWLAFSGVAGSAVGAVLFTLALKHGNPTVINLVLNVQPILSTTAACVLFGDRLGRGFFLWAGVAILSGMLLVGVAPGMNASVDLGVWFALLCALCWGLSTVAGRAVMVEMSVPLAAGLRVMIGLLCMTIIVAWRGLLTPESLWPAAAAAESGKAVTWLVLLATLSGGLPLVLYFRGLELTRASTAGYFEMLQTLAAALITWGIFGAALLWWQVLAGGALLVAVAMVQRAQQETAL